MNEYPDVIKVFITSIIPDIGTALLKKEGFRVSSWQGDQLMHPDEFLEEAMQANALITTTVAVDKDFLSACNHLDIISQFGAGYDNVNVNEATRQGILIGNTPGAMSRATADIAFGLMIAASRKFFYMHKNILNGAWKHFRPTANLGMELENKTIGIFGLGRIGMEMAKRCKGAYNMKVIYTNRNRNEEAETLLKATRVSFDELLKQSDIISVHAALSKETKGIFNKDAFEKMKPTGIFINTSRGPVHNEEDLIAALNNGTIWGAGLDVTDPEPMHPGNPLLGMENVAVLPHIGSATIEARNEMSVMAARNIIEFYKNKKLLHIVNPEALKPNRSFPDN